MFHFANPDAISFVVSQISSMAILMPPFALNVGMRQVESNKILCVFCAREFCRREITYLFSDLFCEEWNEIDISCGTGKLYIGVHWSSNIFQHKSRRTEQNA